MFDMTNDSHLFRTHEDLKSRGMLLDGNVFNKDDQQWMPVFEGKMVDMFDHRYACIEYHAENALRPQQPSLNSIEDHLKASFVTMPYLWAPAREGHIRTSNDWGKKWFPVFKRVTSVTNERTMVGCIIPWTTVSYTLYTVICKQICQNIVICLFANLCSFIGDYLIRQKTSQPSLPLGVIYETACLPPEPYKNTSQWDNKTLYEWILTRVLELTYTAWDLKAFAKDCGYDGPPFRWSEKRRFLLRCELDAAYFHLYGIACDDVDYIMDTFRVRKEKDEKQYGEYRTKRVILEMYDEMQRAIESGVAYQTRLVPGPADPAVAHEPRVEAEV
jgi:hypothetical protein